MKNKNRLYTSRASAIVLIALIIISLAMTQLICLSSINRNVSQRALGEVKETADEQAANVNHNLSLQFNMLESLATYLGREAVFDFAKQEDMMFSFMTTNKFCTVAYTDKVGNILGAVSADGNPPSGSVADRTYFQQAAYWKDARAIQYMEHTAMTDDPRILFAVPVVRKSTVDGVIFASTEQNFFEERLWSGSVVNQAEAFLMDSSGMVIADMSDSGTYQNGYNLFETFIVDEAAQDMQTAMKESKGGTLTVDGKNPCFVAYTATGINDWYVVSVLDKDIATARYAENMRHVRNAIMIISAIFVVCAVFLFFLFESFEKRRKEEIRELEGTSRKLSSFLEKSGNASFEFDARSGMLYASPKLDDLLGYKLPENWYSAIDERKVQHPEFDYQGVEEAYNEALLSGGYKEAVTGIRIDGKGLRWLKISMTAAIDEKGLVCGIVGLVSDITESYVDEHLEKEEQTLIMNEAFSVVPMSTSVNLTKNRYSMINHVPTFLVNLPWQGNFDEFVEQAQHLLPESYRHEFLEHFSADALLKAYRSNRMTVEMEHPFRYGMNDDLKWVLSRACFLTNNASDDLCLVVLVIDISEQKEKALLLQKSYDMTINNMPGFACKWLFDGRDVVLLEANQAFYSFMKAPEEQVRNRSVLYGLDEDRKRSILSELYAKEREKKDIHYSGPGFKLNGEEFWSTVNGTYFSAKDGKSVYLCVLSDITSIVRMHESVDAKNEELRTAAEMSRLLVLKYDVANKKIRVLSNGTKYDNLSRMDGHAPEYAVEKGYIPIVDGASFFNAFRAIEQGKAEGDIRFVVKRADKLKWVSGRYRTMFKADGSPVSAILLLNDDAEVGGVGDSVKTLTDFYDKTDITTKKLMVVNLTQDRLEYESEMDDYSLSQEGVFVFSVAKQRLIEEEKVAADSQKEWLRFLDNERLIRLYKSGTRTDSMVCFANTKFGDNREVSVDVMLQESQYDGSIRAYILFKDLLALAETEKRMTNESRLEESHKKVSVHTFGYFDVYVNGKPISFPHDKSKEMLAVLVDRRGGFVSSSEMIAYLWENEESNKTTQSRCRQVASRLKKTLEENEIGDIIEIVNGKRRIIPEKVDCDYFNYLANKPENRHLFNGSYMVNYSWSEMTTADLESSRSVL